jgi:hypothetical protein
MAPMLLPPPPLLLLDVLLRDPVGLVELLLLKGDGAGVEVVYDGQICVEVPHKLNVVQQKPTLQSKSEKQSAPPVT